MSDLDQRVRLAAFAFLDQQTQLHGETLPRTVLAQGFEFDGRRVPLLGLEGIFKPAILPSIPLSITTAPPSDRKQRPYDDEFDPSGLLRYRYRGRDANHPDNVGLREAMRRQIPLVHVHGVVPGRYTAFGRSSGDSRTCYHRAVQSAKGIDVSCAQLTRD